MEVRRRGRANKLKVRKEGKTLILPLPAKFDIKPGQEFIAVNYHEPKGVLAS